ncbi:MAG: urease accessory protein UreD [Colwellia sp.]|nr:urease accessory protein UreD [Colwellia sp.]
MTQSTATSAVINTTEASALMESKSRQWIANLSLDFSFTALGTQLRRTRRNGPLTVQKAFYPEGRDCAHIYLLHPPAGIVSGDELHVEINLDDNAHTLVTTPGANRFYRARENANIGISKQIQITTLNVNNQAKCENFPQETLVYNGADGFNTVDIHLTNTSVYLGWDITCMGLPSSDQLFTQGQYSQLNRVFVDDALQYHDRIAITAKNNLLHHPAGLAGNSVFATFLMYAPQQLNKSQRKKVIEVMRDIIENNQAQKHISITDIDGLLVIRYLGHHAQQCKNFFLLLWQVVRPLTVEKTATQPRIWHT